MVRGIGDAEDNRWTAEALRAEGFAEEVLEAVACLTRQAGEDYADFIAQAVAMPGAPARSGRRPVVAKST